MSAFIQKYPVGIYYSRYCEKKYFLWNLKRNFLPLESKESSPWFNSLNQNWCWVRSSFITISCYKELVLNNLNTTNFDREVIKRQMYTELTWALFQKEHYTWHVTPKVLCVFVSINSIHTVALVIFSHVEPNEHLILSSLKCRVFYVMRPCSP